MTVVLLAGLMAVVGAAGVLLARRPVHGVLSLVLCFVGLAVLYLSLAAEFMAVIQLIIYAGAIMILFLFVIALLTVGAAPVRRPPSPLRNQTMLALAVAIPVLGLLGYAAATISSQGAVPDKPDFGTVERFGEELLTRHMLPFELTAIVLMIAVVGVVILVGGREGHA